MHWLAGLVVVGWGATVTVMVGVGGEPQAAAKLIAAKIVITRREDLANISMIKGR